MAAQQPAADVPKIATPARFPGFLIAAIAGFVLSLGTPRLILVIPILATVVLGILSLVRSEPYRWGAITVMVLAGLLFIVNVSDFQPGHSVTSAATSAQIVDWNWNPDPTFGTHGTIKWNVSVKNISDKPIRNAKVEFTTYDKSGKLIATTFTYVDAIPAGETRSDSSFADYYGTEDRAEVQLSEVNFAD